MIYVISNNDGTHDESKYIVKLFSIPSVGYNADCSKTVALILFVLRTSLWSLVMRLCSCCFSDALILCLFCLCSHGIILLRRIELLVRLVVYVYVEAKDVSVRSLLLSSSKVDSDL